MELLEEGDASLVVPYVRLSDREILCLIEAQLASLLELMRVMGFGTQYNTAPTISVGGVLYQ